jgi:hypothetical protein
MNGLPFFSKDHDDFVVAERCTCGHLASAHGSQSVRLPDGRLYREASHGNCCETGCTCKHFRWAGFITSDEMARRTKRQPASYL